MKNIFALIGLGLFGFASVGWYLGWYQIQTTPDGHREITIDGNKVKHDVEKGKEKVHDVLAHETEHSPAVPPGFPTSTGTPTPPGTVTIPGTKVTVSGLPQPPSLPPLPTPPQGNGFVTPDGSFVFPNEVTLPGGVTIKTPSSSVPKLPTPQ